LRLVAAFSGCKGRIRIVIQDEAVSYCRIDFVRPPPERVGTIVCTFPPSIELGRHDQPKKNPPGGGLILGDFVANLINDCEFRCSNSHRLEG
jgi:hypothetical protein